MVDNEISYNIETKELFYSYNGVDVSVKVSEVNEKKLLKIIMEIVKDELETGLRIS